MEWVLILSKGNCKCRQEKENNDDEIPLDTQTYLKFDIMCFHFEVS